MPLRRPQLELTSFVGTCGADEPAAPTRAGEQLSDACEFELRPDLMLMLEHEAHAEAEAEEPRSGRHPFDGHTVRRGARATARPRDRATARPRDRTNARMRAGGVSLVVGRRQVDVPTTPLQVDVPMTPRRWFLQYPGGRDARS